MSMPTFYAHLLRILKGKTGKIQSKYGQIRFLLENAKNIPEEQFIFHFFYFPKSRKSELHNVLHGIRAHVKFCSFNTFPLGMVNIYIYIVLVKFIYVKTIIIVLSCLYQYVA